MKIAHEIYEKQKIYKYINEFLISREFNGDECSRYDLTIVLKDFPCWEESEKLTINFLGIKDLKLNDIENLFQVCFNINDISEWQLEKLKYSVKENENNMFSFMCNDIKIS